MKYVEQINQGLNPKFDRKFPVVDWNDVLSKPAPPILSPEYDELCNRAKSWVTCACGNQCAVIPRRYQGCPIDDRLSTYGGDFFEYIKERDWVGARMTLELIEARASQLVKEILGDEKQVDEAQHTC